MSEAVKSNELLSALDPSKRIGKRDTNNLALADQIQFSSILRTLVDTPEKMMEVATGPAKPREMDHRSDKPAEREISHPKQVDRRRETRRDWADDERSYEPRVRRPDAVDSPRPTARTAESSEPAPEKAAATSESASRQTAAVTDGKKFRNEVLDADQPNVVGSTIKTAEADVQNSARTATSAPGADSEQDGQSILAQTLVNKHAARVGEDQRSASKPQSSQPGFHAGAQSAASTLKDEQAGDLSTRLGNVGPVSVHVDVAGEAAKSRPSQLPGFGAGVDFGKFEGFDFTDPGATGQFKGNGEGTGPEQKSAANHANLPGDRNGVPVQQDLATAFSQAMRAQAAVVGPQQAMMRGADGDVPLSRSDTIQLNGVSAANGPTQLSQTAKAALAAPPRQPEKPQTPAEQIAVKIRQAVGEGSDKINIKLNPHELGRVEVRLELAKDGSMTATVLAERKETLDMLQRDARGLERALNDAGLKTDATSLSFGLRGDGQKTVDNGRERKNGPNSSRQDDRTNARIEFGEDAALAKAGNYGRTPLANGGVDIRV